MSQTYFFLQDNSRLPLLDDSDGNQLATLYNNVLQFVERNCVEVMEIAARVAKKHGKGKVVGNGTSARESPAPDMGQGGGAADTGFEIMSNVVWAEIGRALMDELGALIFAAGKPAEFKSVSVGIINGVVETNAIIAQNYTTTKAFISGLEYLAPDLQSVKAMRTHPIYATFERRWQLPVYFQLRWREIVTDLEAALGDGKFRPSLGACIRIMSFKELANDPSDYDSSGGSAHASAVVSSIAKCWSSDVFIPELGHRFWKLTLQVCSKVELSTYHS
jgi:hypothetical protein